MRAAVFYYDRFAEFEIALSLLLFAGRIEELVHLGLENREYRSEEGQRFLVDAPIADRNPASFDLLLIPGGDPTPLFGNATLRSFIAGLLANGGKVAGICGGAVLLGNLGFLDGRRATGNTDGIRPEEADAIHYAKATIVGEHVVTDGPVTTAQGQAYAEFATRVAMEAGLFSTAEEGAIALDWLKNRR